MRRLQAPAPLAGYPSPTRINHQEDSRKEAQKAQNQAFCFLRLLRFFAANSFVEKWI
jgi:hypothetical protein